ncbi:hypothetical protein FOZ63_029666 [Perkinsus olseni]|nr:hypothetical protein FOZ63_029666 [Perkinsus olseni]KAF4741043.1 hypothetical protein FOZ62_030757 [Perkinsus olseni]
MTTHFGSYKLFPRLNILRHVKSMHVAYYPGRQHVEVAKRLVMSITSEPVQKKYPQFTATWELLAYDGPATIDVEFLNGDKRRFMADHFSDGEMNSIVENWKFQAMTDTGIDASCLVAYNSFKQNRDKRYIIFRVNDYDQVVVASEGDRDKTYEDFTKAINDEKEPAYGVVDFKPEGSEEDKTVLFVWGPDTSSIKKRMM